MVDKFKFFFSLVSTSVQPILLLIGLLSSAAGAEVMFEGYSIIRSGSTPIGYTIQRYEFDAKKKQFTATSFLKTNALGGNLTESLKAVANDKFQPVNYQYVEKVGEKVNMIDAKFSKQQMTATVTDGKISKTVKETIKPGVFLSTFLGYLMLQNGYKADKKFTYSAIAEEDGVAQTGTALIRGEEDFKGQKVFRIINNFKNTEFISFVNGKGEILGTNSPLKNINTELVANAAEATKGFIVPADTLKILFGTVPSGKVNVLAGKLNTLSGTTPPPAEESSAPTNKTTAVANPAIPTQQSVPIKPPPQSSEQQQESAKDTKKQ